ncbi:translation initiation factor 2 (bIF-2) [Cuneatibacter caecimuris]|uniref:Translation initiation factor IF-2 n=2 Tax=Cuneatibacter caecimuris TaxID=1796618 RepID=A0A4Q7P2E8_9FIRM|nr:translation initiation factor 2 (bIF-2) [Cuneatibacter caecimuris]
MSKMRVHELAKELGKSNKELMEILKSKNIEVQSQLAGLTEEQVSVARAAARAGKPAPAAQEKKAAVEKTASPASGDAKEPSQEIPKKKRFAAVFRPQNGSQPVRSGQGDRKPAGKKPPVKPAEEKAAAPAAKPSEVKEKVLEAQMVKPVETKEKVMEVKTEKPAEAVQKPVENEKAPVPSKENRPQDENRRENQNRDSQNRSGQQRTGSYGNRDGQSRDGQQRTGGYGNRDGQQRTGSYGNRDGQGRDGQQRTGGYGNRDGQSRDGQQRTGGYGNRDGQSRDGQQRTGSYGNRDGQSRDGQQRTGSYGNRDGQQRTGSYGNRDGQSRDGQQRTGSYGNRDGQNRPGGYGNRDGQNRPGGYGNRDGQSRPGGYGNRDGQNRPGGYGNRDGQNRPGGYGNRDGQSRPGGYGNRDGQSRPGGYGNRDGQNRPGGYGNRDGQNRPGQNRDGGRPRTGETLTPVVAKNTETRGGKPVNKKEREMREKSKQYGDSGKKFQENTRNLKIKAPAVQRQEKKEEETIRTLVLPEILTIKELADKMKQQPSALVKKLFLQGKMVTINSEIDYDTAEEIALDFNCICEKEVKVDVIEELLKDVEDSKDSLTPRPPVVCVMGHVDHGKTSLLDAIRQTHVIDKEAGGITQHIGAYMVTAHGQKVTFLDTPGHEAFTAMRMRGAQSTDIAILVVAADDGVMPQTVEAINHAKAAGVEIIVAVNKIDKPSANVDRVKQEMSEYELIPEDWGGDTIFVPVSAKTGEGLENLLDMILLVAEVKELKANPDRTARGLVLEAQLDKGRGPVATVLVQKGTLHVGDSIAAGSCYGKVRAMIDDKGRRIKEASPSVPVEILGLNDVPNAGEIFVCTPTEKEARSFAETFISEGREKLIEDTKAKMSLDDLFSQIKAGNVKELNIIIKADVQGSVEAVKQSLVKLSNEEVVVKVIHGGVGAINESDVTLAATSNAIIIGFNVRPDVTAKSVAEREKVDMRLYRVIYQAIEDVEAAMKGMLDPVFEEKVLGHAVVRQTFKASGVGTIAGSYVTDGVFQRNCSCRITRDGVQIFEGALASLKRFKDDVKEVKEGYECGLVFEKFNDIKEEDIVEAYTMVEVPR